MRRVLLPALLLLALSANGGSAQRRDTLLRDSTRTAFALRLFHAAAREAPDRNLLLSPEGARFLLTPLYAASSGATRDALKRTLDAGGFDPVAVDWASGRVAEALRRSEGARVQVLSSIWVDDDASLSPAFAASMRDRHRARAASVDLQSAAGIRRINAWARASSAGRVREVVDAPLDAATRLVVTGVVSFRGRWRYPFGVSATRPAVFHAPGGDRSVPTMTGQTFSSYGEGPGWRAAVLAFEERWEMALVLPDSGTTPAELAGRLDAAGWTALRASLRTRELTLHLPRFSFASGGSLRGLLGALGMEEAFGAAASFPGLLAAGSAPVRLGDVVQRTWIAVDEEGVEAVASTSFSATGFGPSPAPAELRLDRPFLFAIHDRLTETLLFVGQVADPSQGGG